MSKNLFDQFPPTYDEPDSDFDFQIKPSDFSGRIIFDLKSIDCGEDDEVMFMCGYEMSEDEWIFYDQHDENADALINYIFPEEASNEKVTNSAESVYSMMTKNGQTVEECKKYITEKLLAAGCIECPVEY